MCLTQGLDLAKQGLDVVIQGPEFEYCDYVVALDILGTSYHMD